MNNPIDKIIGQSFDELLPINKFNEFSRIFGETVTDNTEYYRALYPTFKDYDQMHDTSKTEPVYLNDFDFNVVEDRERLEACIRMNFDSDTFQTTATCGCDKPLVGNYLVGSGRVCPNCGNQVERVVDIELSTKVWLRLPTGVHSFINPAFYKTFLSCITTTAPKIEIISFIIDPSYRRKVIMNVNSSSDAKSQSAGEAKVNALKAELKKVLKRLDLNEFVLNADAVLEHFLEGPGRTLLQNKSRKETSVILEGCRQFRNLMFCKYLPVPNKLTTVIEKYGKDRIATGAQLKKDSCYMTIADTKDQTDSYTVTEQDIQESVNRVGKGIVQLADQGESELTTYMFPKNGAARKVIASGSLPLTGRSVITSITGIHNPSYAVIPWIMGMAQLEPMIISHLYRLGYSPSKVLGLISESYHQVTPDIDKFLKYHENRMEIVGKLGRMPSIQYLSRRSFFLRINRDLDDQSIGLPILSCSAYNADRTMSIVRNTVI